MPVIDTTFRLSRNSQSRFILLPSAGSRSLRHFRDSSPVAPTIMAMPPSDPKMTGALRIGYGGYWPKTSCMMRRDHRGDERRDEAVEHQHVKQ